MKFKLPQACWRQWARPLRHRGFIPGPRRSCCVRSWLSPGLSFPVRVYSIPSDTNRIFVVQQGGIIPHRRPDDQHRERDQVSRPVVDRSERGDHERGRERARPAGPGVRPELHHQQLLLLPCTSPTTSTAPSGSGDSRRPAPFANAAHGLRSDHREYRVAYSPCSTSSTRASPTTTADRSSSAPDDMLLRRRGRRRLERRSERERAEPRRAPGQDPPARPQRHFRGRW